MHYDIGHRLQTLEASQRVDRMIGTIQRIYSLYVKEPVSEWNSQRTELNYSCVLLGVPVQGRVVNADGRVAIEVTLPPEKAQLGEVIRDVVFPSLEKCLL